MSNTTKHIQKLNELYCNFKRNYTSMKKMFKNHTTIKQKIILSEQFLFQAYKLISEELESIETNKQFNRIIKDIKNEKNDFKNN